MSMRVSAAILFWLLTAMAHLSGSLAFVQSVRLLKVHQFGRAMILKAKPHRVPTKRMRVTRDDSHLTRRRPSLVGTRTRR